MKNSRGEKCNAICVCLKWQKAFGDSHERFYSFELWGNLRRDDDDDDDGGDKHDVY